MSKERYIGGKTGGIPEEVFSRTDRGYFTAKSGRTMRKDIARAQIALADRQESNMRFEAIVNPGRKTFGIEVPPGLISIEVRNKGFGGEADRKHPDIYPEKLLRRSKSYFETQGHTVNGLAGRWTQTEGLTDNFEQYKKGLELYGETPDGKIKAARSTWTGKVAEKLGFTDIRGPYELKTGTIFVVFTR